jgi:hypothetical protein
MIQVSAQQVPVPAAPVSRAPDRKPNFSGVWQALSPAGWDLQDHSAQLGIQPGQGVVVGGEIPYQPWALKKKQENAANRITADPLRRCFLPGVPRATYLGVPFEIVQGPRVIVISYEYAHAIRPIYLDGTPHPDGIDFWMGDSRGRWEGDTLVVDVRNLNDQTWFDKAGNFHSDSLHVVERYTPLGPNHINYEATIDDPKVFTRPWTIRMPLYRRLEPNVRLLDNECYLYQIEEKYKSSK